MPIITAIKPQRNKKRVNIYLDGKFGFGLDLENYMKLNLKVEQEIDEIELEELIEKAEFAKTFDKLLRFATIRPKSRREVEMWFRKHKVHTSLHEKLINKLTKLELLDDHKFAKWWVEQRNNFRPRGKRALTAELFQKGIEKEIINEVLDEAEIDEAKIAKELLSKNEYKWRRFDDKKAKQKKSAFLARKGFGWDIIREIITNF